MDAQRLKQAVKRGIYSLPQSREITYVSVSEAGDFDPVNGANTTETKQVVRGIARPVTSGELSKSNQFTVEDWRVVFSALDLTNEPNTGDRLEFDDHEWGVVPPIQSDAIKASWTLTVRRN